MVAKYKGKLEALRSASRSDMLYNMSQLERLASNEGDIVRKEVVGLKSFFNVLTQ